MASNDPLPAVPERRPDLVTWMFGLDRPTLTDRPQRWGVVPTFRFWNRLDTAKYQLLPVAAGLALALVFLELTMSLAVAVLGALAPVLLGPIAIALGLLPLGLFERWLRREIATRRALPPASDPPT
ncbi:MAG: hypothetical protein H6713_23500 [Myxococcales bacterium]|nr:hypothetical protein [Myxococcales bacterium]MCB9752932.1 hypothetical protein [Myxococcales bacterium]